MRGKHLPVALALLLVGGSSPHARETQSRTDRRHSRHRLIPACAGNTISVAAQAYTCPAHPRMRGKHNDLGHSAGRLHGSSPHARETRAVHDHYYYALRLIPACAGNTTRRTSDRQRPSAHPRMRGKHFLGNVVHESGCGSSPHARETQSSGDPIPEDLRLIPACAGNTRRRRTARRRRRAHPRMRGKHQRSLTADSFQNGSSPHARETPVTCRQAAGLWRLIPACAGNTAVSSPAMD